MTIEKYDVVAVLQRIGISEDDARALRRISVTLRRWYEHECNGAIQRDEGNKNSVLVHYRKHLLAKIRNAPLSHARPRSSGPQAFSQDYGAVSFAGLLPTGRPARVQDVCEAYTSKTASWTGEIVRIGGAKVIRSNGVSMDRDYNGARGIFLRALVDTPSLAIPSECNG